MLHDFLEENDFLDQSNVLVIKPELLSENLLKKTHSADYIARIQEISETGVGDIDIDTPGFKDIYFHSRIASGASITGVHSVMSGNINHFFLPLEDFIMQPLRKAVGSV
ncbi:hypothetical protein E4H12_00220 [Candidatus Thorarchaeota archaeon]|nr:MAG: hypothetical protein E4H12_00220 [Candidatus Thorarchaeota archaeon]